MDNTERTIEEMKAQIAILKKKIENEQIVNEKIVRSSVRKDYSVIRRHVATQICSSIFVIIMAWTYFPMLMGLSYWFSAATTVLMLCAMAYSIWMTRHVKMSNVMTLDLASAARMLKKVKKNYDRWMIGAIPVMIGWVAWFAYEIYKVSDSEKLFLATMVGMGVGGVCGIILALRMRKKFFDACDDVISQTSEID